MDTEKNAVSGAKLKKIRTDAGLTMPQLAELSGIGLDNLKSYETGRRNINIARVDILKTLAQALHCKIEDLLDE